VLKIQVANVQVPYLKQGRNSSGWSGEGDESGDRTVPLERAELTQVGDATGHRRGGEARAIQRRSPNQLGSVMASVYQQKIALKLVCLVKKEGRSLQRKLNETNME
jgi:hypothetical protein